MGGARVTAKPRLLFLTRPSLLGWGCNTISTQGTPSLLYLLGENRADRI